MCNGRKERDLDLYRKEKHLKNILGKFILGTFFPNMNHLNQILFIAKRIYGNIKRLSWFMQQTPGGGKGGQAGSSKAAAGSLYVATLSTLYSRDCPSIYWSKVQEMLVVFELHKHLFVCCD